MLRESARRYLLFGVFLAAVCAGAGCSPSPPNLLYITRDGGLTLVSINLTSMTARSAKTHHTSDVLWASWSCDGGRVAVTVRDGEQRTIVNILDADEGTLDVFTRLTEPGHTFWAPAGGWLCIDFGTGFGRELVLYRLGTETPFHSLFYCGGFAWSPDGTRLLLGRNRKVEPPMPWEGGGSADIVVSDLTTGEETELVSGSADVMYLPFAWPEEERVLISRLERDRHPSTLLSLDLTTGDMAPAALPREHDRDAVRQLLPESLRESFSGTFEWNSDLSAVALVIYAETGPEVWIVRPDEQNTRTARIGLGHSPAWRPEP